MPGGRRGFQLRGQRENFRHDALRESVRAARGGRCGLVRGRGFRRASSDSRPPARIRDGARVLGTAVFTRAKFAPSSIERGSADEVEIARTRRSGARTRDRAAIADGKIVGWFQGAREWGPRALGNRSILADPRRPEMKDILNRRIKHREIFRPFAPSILGRGHRRIFREDASFAFHDVCLSRARGKTQRDSRADARGRHSAPANREPHVQSALLEIAACRGRSYGRAGRAEHFVQRQRADRLPPRRSARMFPPHAHGRAGAGQFHARKEVRIAARIARRLAAAHCHTQRGQRSARERHAHPALERILSARHFRDREDGRAGGGDTRARATK